LSADRATTILSAASAVNADLTKLTPSTTTPSTTVVVSRTPVAPARPPVEKGHGKHGKG